MRAIESNHSDYSNYRLIGLLHGLFGMLGQKGDLSTVLHLFLTDLGEYLEARGGCLLLADGEKAADFGRMADLHDLQPLMHEVFDFQRPALMQGKRGTSFVGVPLVSEDRLIGGMFFTRDPDVSPFVPSEFPLLGIIALPLAIHLENLEFAQANAARRAELEAVLASMADGLLVVDHDGLVRSFNQTFKDLVGEIPDELFGKPWTRFFEGLEGLEGVESPEAFHSALKEGQRYSGKCRAVLPREEPLTVALAMNTVVTQESQVAGGVINIRDVSLETQIDRLKDEFIATVSHELRTPLTIIRGFLEMMISRPMEREEQAPLFEVMHGETGRLERLIADLLELSKIQSNRLALHPRTFLLERLLKQCLLPFQARHGETHQFLLEVTPSKGRIRADFDRLSQAIVNLVGNAVKYSPEGGPIRVKAAREGRRWSIEVTDAGIGIPEKNLKQLFTRFYRVNENQTKGSGLGLFITKQIIERHGGSITVQSKLGEGTTFTVFL